MSKIRLGLGTLTIPQKVAKAKQIAKALDGNPKFPTPSPSLAVITAAADALETAYAEAQAARQTAKEKTSIQNEKEDALDGVLNQEAAYVESVSGGSEQDILSAGMDLRGPNAATQEAPTQPQALAPREGAHDGEIDLTWDVVRTAKSYAIERSDDPVTGKSWAHIGVSTRASFTASGLTSGTRYWFRVAAINNNGQSGWSDPATKIAP